MPNFGSMLAGLKKGGQWLGAEDQAGLRGAIGGAVGGQSGWGSGLGKEIGGAIQRRRQLPTEMPGAASHQDMMGAMPEVGAQAGMPPPSMGASPGMVPWEPQGAPPQPQQQANPFGKKGM
jgi:hypothetical protein